MQGYNLKYVVPTQGLFVAFFIALIISQVAAMWPSGRAARLQIIEAIQFE
jgi:ABC-type lipoprotein release transport system permease subunit